jgi:DNA-binding Lrp family transcriptional regulator
MEAMDAPENSHDLNRDMAAMVKLITEVGPRIPEIARRMGRHKETVRYWYKKLEERDFSISARINHEALGLRRVVMKVKFGKDYVDYVKPLMFAMNELSYLVSYTKTLPEDVYVLEASIPVDYTAEYVDFVETLKQQGVFASVEYYMLDWVRNKPMQAELYDFEHGVWDFDLVALSQEDGRAPYVEPPISPRAKFDKIDLLITKELAADASRELQEIQRSIKEKDGIDINYKTLCWHLSEHVEKRLLKGYRLNWMGTSYDPVNKRGKQRQHSFLGVDILARGVRNDEKLQLLEKIGRLPILWFEGAGSDYYAQVAIPSELTVEGLQYLQTAMKSVSDRCSFLIADQRESIAFAISYKLFDETAKAWKFNREEILEKFEALEAQISESAPRRADKQQR